jgi:hypothetical protein
MQVVVLQHHGHVVWSTPFGHTVELLNRESQLANVRQSKSSVPVFDTTANLHLREVAPGNNAMKDYRGFAVVAKALAHKGSPMSFA